MRKQLDLRYFVASAVFAAATLFSPAGSAFAQSVTSFSEPSIHSAHLLYTEGSFSSSSSFGRTDAFAMASDASNSSSEAMMTGTNDAGYSGVTRPVPAFTPAMKPFRAFAVAAKVGSGGIGFDVATPMAQRLNLRVGASFFQYSPSFTEDGLQISGTLKLQNASASVDIYPFNNSFRISPGLTFKNNNGINAALVVPGGQSFSLGDDDYTSSPVDPIHGTASFGFGTSNIAPRLTMGFGNMLPRKGGHFSVPVEAGFQYIAQPTVKLTFAGSACNNQGCGPVDPASVAQEQSELQSDLSPLRFYPIVSIGISYRIGGKKVY